MPGREPAAGGIALCGHVDVVAALHALAALGRDAAYDACLIPEPTELAVVCTQAGALTFTGTVTGRAAHAAARLEGVSAIDRYLPLPYPIVVGRLEAGLWSSQVPARLTPTCGSSARAGSRG